MKHSQRQRYSSTSHLSPLLHRPAIELKPTSSKTRGVISEVYQEVLEHYKKENLPVFEAFENWWKMAILKEKEFLRTAREEDQFGMKVVKTEEVDFDVGLVEGRDIEDILHVDVVECLNDRKQTLTSTVFPHVDSRSKRHERIHFRDVATLYGYRPSAQEDHRVWYLSPYEFVTEWEVVYLNYPQMLRGADSDGTELRGISQRRVF